VAVALGIHQAMSVHHMVISGPSGSTIFFHIISKMARFSLKKIIEHEMCVMIFSKNFVWNVSHSEKRWARYYHKGTLDFKSSTRCYCHIL